MAGRERIDQHPLMVALAQAEAEVANMPPTVAQVMPALSERLPPTLAYLRLSLQAADPNVVSDQALSNFHSWTQQVASELQNSRNNPGQPQFVQNVNAGLDAIAQNFAQIPTAPGPSRLQGLAEEAHRRLDQIQTLEATTQDKARSATDQINAEVMRARDATEAGLARARENEAQANELLAQLGAKGTSSSYLSTADSEKKIADQWRYVTLGVAVIAAIVAIVLLHDVHTHSVSAIIGRASASLPGLFLTLYCGRQAAEHRTQERETRALGLQLAGLSLFLVDLGGDGRQLIKQGVAERLFAAGQNTSISEGYPRSQDELLKLLATVINKLR